MEIIRKQISMDDSKSHKNGLLPFVRDGKIILNVSDELNYNYGQFVCDLLYNENDPNNSYVIKYLDIINGYNFIINEMNKGIYGYGTNVNGKLVIEEYKQDILNCNNLNFPENIFDYIPLDINEFNIIDNNTYQTLNVKNYKNGFYVLLNNFEEILKIDEFFLQKFNIENTDGLYSHIFVKLVKDNLIEKKINSEYIKIGNSEFKLVTPYVEIPLLLEGVFYADSMYHTYDEYYNESDDAIYNLIDENYDALDSNLKPKRVVNLNIEVESKLDSLIHFSAIDIGDEIFGIPTYCNKIYKCSFQNKKLNGIPIEVLNKDDYICGNGEIIKDGDLKYRTIPFLSCLDYFNIEEDGTFYFYVTYENSENNPIKIPFVNNECINIDTYYDGKKSGDSIIGIEKNNDENSITLTYIIGADLTNIKNEYKTVNNTGIIYKEKLNYLTKYIHTFVDGFECDIYYEYIDYDTNLKTIYNNVYDSFCNIRIARITDMTTFDIWRDNLAVNLPLITKESTESTYSNPKINVDIAFNRGNAAGWEKHFKLSECNTMKDLENYGNNFFNL